MTLDLAAIRAANAARAARQAAALESHRPLVLTEGAWVERKWMLFELSEPDYALYQAARTDDAPAVIDALCAEVERLRAVIDALRPLTRPIGYHPPKR